MDTRIQTQGEIWEQDTMLLPRIDLHPAERHDTIPMPIFHTRPLPAQPRKWQFVSVRKLFSRASHE